LNFAVDREHLRDLTVGQGLGKVTCQVLPPDFDGYQRYCPYTAAPTKTGAWTAPDLARARQLVRASGTVGRAVTVWMPSFIPFSTAAGRYVVSVLDSLGYKARLRAPRFNPFLRENKLHVQLGFWGWIPDFAATPAGFIPPAFACSAYTPVSSQNQAVAEFCDPAIDREMARAQSLQATDPEAASQLWAKIDHDVTWQAPWVPFANGVVLEVVSERVGNYQYNPQYGTLLDQLWVR
jgi:peptide/nickel transport system substrate-binding protein